MSDNNTPRLKMNTQIRPEPHETPLTMAVRIMDLVMDGAVVEITPKTPSQHARFACWFDGTVGRFYSDTNGTMSHSGEGQPLALSLAEAWFKDEPMAWS